jgi:hypothetical protein
MHGAEPRERLAQAAVAFGDEERQPEHAAPGPPFGDDVVAFARCVERQRQGRIAVLEHDGNGRRIFVRFVGEADGDAAERGERQIQCHAHTADTPVQHYALAMKINDTQMLVSGRVSDCETHGQGERVEPRRAARPGSEPAGFHLTPSKTEAPPRLWPPGCRQNARSRSQSA